jgi:hypothetical protein
MSIIIIFAYAFPSHSLTSSYSLGQTMTLITSNSLFG